MGFDINININLNLNADSNLLQYVERNFGLRPTAKSDFKADVSDGMSREIAAKPEIPGAKVIGAGPIPVGEGRGLNNTEREKNKSDEDAIRFMRTHATPTTKADPRMGGLSDEIVKEALENTSPKTRGKALTLISAKNHNKSKKVKTSSTSKPSEKSLGDPKDPENWMQCKEFSDAAGIPYATVMGRVAKGAIRSHKVHGRKKLIHVSELQKAKANAKN